METKVVLCDECKKQLAKEKCRNCERDICSRCRIILSVNLSPKIKNYDSDEERNSQVALGSCFICKTCKRNMKILTKKGHQDIIQKIVEYVKNEIVIGELEGEKNETGRSRKC